MEITILQRPTRNRRPFENFVEYTGMLLEQKSRLCRLPEAAKLRGRAGQPAGKVWGARGAAVSGPADGAPAGYVAMKKLDAQRCELKRLYIRPAFRGQGLARRLVERLLTDARSEGTRLCCWTPFPSSRGDPPLPDLGVL